MGIPGLDLGLEAQTEFRGRGLYWSKPRYIIGHGLFLFMINLISDQHVLGENRLPFLL
jgi:hypothetical protein